MLAIFSLSLRACANISSFLTLFGKNYTPAFGYEQGIAFLKRTTITLAADWCHETSKGN